ncbi:uncharacterized protein LOC135835821 [Planococcus citri]|uniref:uncharacterized protein LOC135835821 n=1 Tax=Planococcus citri TaxID=170843 RepID=UPI0031F76300
MERVFFSCADCGSQYHFKNSLVKHIKKQHLAVSSGNRANKNYKKKESRIICACCNKRFNFFRQYFEHLRDAHEINIEKETERFSNEEGFEAWKKSKETETASQFVKDFQAKKQKSGDSVSWYHCHRSFNFRLHRKAGFVSTKKKTKNLGTNKLNFTSPAHFKLIRKQDGNLIVEFYKTHIGHECEVQRMRLHSDDRYTIAGKLNLGVPATHILANIRNSSSDNFEEDEKLTRLHLTTKKDIRNIATSFDINNPLQKHSIDFQSVELFCLKMQKMEEGNPILFYKKQGESSDVLKDEDFTLVFCSKFQRRMLTKFGHKAICIDGTHGTNGYKFQLYTIIVLDEWDEGIPVAFAISNREDEDFFKIFFESLKSEVGDISTELFMSDDASAFYNAWVKVMGKPKQKLLCLWHVHKNWTTNKTKIKKEKRKEVMKDLSAIAEELDPENFKNEFENFIKQLENDPDTVAFAAYIRRAYYNNMHSWARCFRKHVPIQTNMNLEAFHRALKYDYLGGVKCSRIDKLLYALMSVVRDKHYQRVIKKTKKTPYKNISKIIQSHQNSANIDDIRIHNNENTWIVKNKYVVHRITNVISACCQRICKSCNICVHMFTCSCYNNAVDYNICKHIHACAAKFFTLPAVDEDQVIEVEEIVITPSQLDFELTEPDLELTSSQRNIGPFQAELEADVQVESSCLRTDAEIKNEIHLKNELIQGLIIRNLPVDKGEEMIKLQDRIISLYNTYSDYSFAKKRVESGKIEKQTFYPTRKSTAKPKQKFPRISTAARELIQKGFQQGTDEVVHVHNELDHVYHNSTTTSDN